MQRIFSLFHGKYKDREVVPVLFITLFPMLYKRAVSISLCLSPSLLVH